MKKKGLPQDFPRLRQKSDPTGPVHENSGCSSPPAAEICFGLNRETDERSLSAFLRKFADPVFLGTLIPRLEDAEFIEVLDFLSRLMHKHISEEEYHRLFLAD